MSLLGIDIGTTGCKTAVFSEKGQMLAFAYQEYHYKSPKPGWAQLDTIDVWKKVKFAIGKAISCCDAATIQALCVSSMGEALVPVSMDRKILGPSILNFDKRGSEYLDDLNSLLPKERLYDISGNTLGNHFSLTKLKWIKENQPEIYQKTNKFLPWVGFVSFMLGAAPIVDYSLANRTLLFDVNHESWSEEIIGLSKLDYTKLPAVSASGTVIGTVSNQIADELGLPQGVAIVNGAHDQCANAVGCGAIVEGRTLLGMGTFICAAPVFSNRKKPEMMIKRGLNTEHHAIPGKYVTFIYNQGGSIIKWYRDTFALIEHQQCTVEGKDIYTKLFSEMPNAPSRTIVLPYFASTGFPDFNTETSGVIAGLKLDTERGEILKGMTEGVIFDLKEYIDSLPPTGINITDFRVVGGGSKSNVWIQTCADILGLPLSRPEITESGAIGSAITAGVGIGVFPSFKEGVASMVRLERNFAPNPQIQSKYENRFEKYYQLKLLLKNYLKELSQDD